MPPLSNSGTEFSRLLEEALGDAQTIRRQAEELADSVLVAPPLKIYDSAIQLEQAAHEGRFAMERLLEIFKQAHLHTLESAYRALISQEGRISDAEKLRNIIDDYRRVRSVIDMSREHIEAAMGALSDQHWRVPLVLTSDETSERAGNLIAKA